MASEGGFNTVTPPLRGLNEVGAMDADMGNHACLDQVGVQVTSYFFLKYVVVLLTFTMPMVFKHRLNAQRAREAGAEVDAGVELKRSYKYLAAYVALLLTGVVFMEKPVKYVRNTLGFGMFSINQAYFVYTILLVLYVLAKDFGHRAPALRKIGEALGQKKWFCFFWDILVFGAGVVWIPIMGTWTLFRCYDFMDSVGHLIPSGSYFVWSAVLMCFYGNARERRLRLLQAESYMWFIFGTIFFIYNNAQSGGGIFRSYFHDEVYGLWMPDQQHTMISLCWLTAAVISTFNVKMGYQNSFHFLVIAPPAAMAMFDHPKPCHRTELSHRMHGCILIASLLFRAFDRTHEASLLFFLAGLSFVSSTKCLIVWSIQNQVVEMFVWMILASGAIVWSYGVYTLREHIFSEGDLHVCAGGRPVAQYSALGSDEHPEADVELEDQKLVQS